MKKISLCFAIALIFSHQSANSIDGILGKTIDLTIDAVKSDFAINLYLGICTHVLLKGSETILEPALAKYRRVTGSESLVELKTLDVKQSLKEKQLELDKTEFELQLAKLSVLAKHFPEYEAMMQNRIQSIKKSDKPEEKQKKVSKKEAQLKQTQKNFEKAYSKRFEHLVTSTSKQLDHLLKKAKGA